MRITATHLRIRREHFGFSRAQLATILGCTPGVIADWEDGREPVPHRIGGEIEDIARRTDEYLVNLIAQYAAGDRTLDTYRTDEAYEQHHPGGPYTASWHRALCGRVLQIYPDVTIECDDLPGPRKPRPPRGKAAAARSL